MADLNADVLKRTAGLLAEIDRVVAAPSVAERVERVLSSAAPNLRDATYDSFEAWAHFHGDGTATDRIRAVTQRHTPTRECGCEIIEVEETPECTEPDCDFCEPRTFHMRLCEFYDSERVSPIEFHFGQAPHDYPGPVHAAQKPCGAPGCACTGLFEPLFNHIDRTVRFKGAQISYERFDEMLRGPSSSFVLTQRGQVYEDLIHARFLAMPNPLPALFDIDTV